jgi:hypothetical protein
MFDDQNVAGLELVVGIVQAFEQLVRDIGASMNVIFNSDWDEANFAGARGRDFLWLRWG